MLRLRRNCDMLALTLLQVAILLATVAHAARPLEQSAMDQAASHSTLSSSKRDREKHPYHTPTGLFIQERASKQLPGPGQHFSFGALVTWDRIHEMLDDLPDAKLVFLIRHGQAVSNYLSDFLGPDEWFKWETKCSYHDANGTFWGIFDADLTDLGKAEADALNSMLKDGSWFDTLTAGRPARTVVSPLSRCLETATRALKGLSFTEYNVEENVRETLGEDTCDARRAASDPAEDDKEHLQGVCKFELGLRSKFPHFDFPVTPPHRSRDDGGDGDDEGGGDEAAAVNGHGDDDPTGPSRRDGFGLLADADPLWTEDRETQGHQTKRALAFLRDLWTFAPEKVVFVVTHSGFTRSVLLAVGREPYRPQNTELVPVLVQKLPSF
ncbi:hypothetical protein VOLCADRAFT_103079 [Volvox carteri f. nagariensis]|uniref:Phosphoglycerate mutase n=1 Tax=Volvox carteri f. nagariensis TaxID=3068 RepID=D8TJR8_VOLCA|nr:uncharacterized protein VOLCADRAFT_103079 [Volvox carteri f. nagariensis]EFJ52590.1 hypothetical protein VOLCADRAFT_103079 [Volvox carteri f. nagariensis]|eukprot:XP_002946663.1 hypothetical protein VOLCADRAFT_103079 [Volvox carteri f. nagariensis]